MPKLTKVENLSSSSVESVSNRPSASKAPHIHEVENGVPFFDGKFSIRTANRPVLRQKAYKLLYKIYSQMGIAKDKSTDLWLSIFDCLPETTTLVANNHKGEIGGAITLVFDSPMGLPADELYKKEIDALRNPRRKICELISFGLNEAVRGSVKILAILYYSAYLLAWRKEKATDFVVTVAARHERFYCRTMKFNKIGAVRSYSKVNGIPTVLLNLPLQLPDMSSEKQRLFPLNILKYSLQEELDIAEKIQDMHRPMSDEEFYTFFIEKTNVWEQASHQQKEFIKKVYPADKVNHNEVSRALARAFSKKFRSSEAAQKSSAKLAQK